MWWIGLLVGAGLGGMAGRGEGLVAGAFVGAFIGWFIGMVVKAMRMPSSKPVAAPSSLEARVQHLERAVAELQRRLAAGGVAMPAAAAPEAATMAAPAAPVEPAPFVEPVEFEPIPEAPPPRPKPAPEPAPPPKPNPIMAWLAGGNTIARVGLLILFIGLAFLLKYAADHSMLPIELRVASVAIVGIALLGVGWWLRDSRRAYALGLQGAGVAVLYLTTFAALRLWGLLPAEAAFGMLAAIAVFSAILAIRQDALVLAAFGAGGGFLAPILASTGGGSHVALFSYYLLLNLGIAAIAWHKAWRLLNLIGFVFTFFIGLAWGFRFYRPEYLDTTEPFLIAFFVLYVAIAVLYARKQSPSLRHYVDGTIVFGNPLAAFGLQAALMRGVEFGLAFSSLAVAALYMVLAALLRRSKTGRYALLSDAFLALGVAFATAAIPLALDARWTSAAWAVEGAAIVWVGIRQRRRLARLFGLLLQPLAGAALLKHFTHYRSVDVVLDPLFVGALLIAVAGLIVYRLMARAEDDVLSPWERGLVPIAFVWGLGWWLFAGHWEIANGLSERRVDAHVLFLAATALGLAWTGWRRGWMEAAVATRFYLPALVAWAVLATVVLRHPAEDLGWIAWPFAIAVHFAILAKGEEGLGRWTDVLHMGGALLIAFLGAEELHWVAATYTAHHTAWSVASVAIVPALVLWIASMRAMDTRWPVEPHARAYRMDAARVIALALALWSVYANFAEDGRSDPLPYLPLLNALDLAHIFAGLALAATWMAWNRSEAVEPHWPPRNVMIVAGAFAFLWLNGVLLRTLHHWAGVPYDFEGIMRSMLAQAALSIFWAVLALGAMVYATRKGRRSLWIAGGGLMGVVVVKLLLVDLSRAGGIERIVSFIAVGLLMLVIGYFSPVPPKNVKEAA